MEKTGHRSLEDVRSYKRTNMEQLENLSDIMSATKRKANGFISCDSISSKLCFFRRPEKKLQ